MAETQNVNFVQEYWIDAWQRSILSLDVLRQRGNTYLEQSAKNAPNVLSFPFELVRDGRTLPRPVNYMLVRIVPPAGTAVDPAKPPFVVVDPRAGHGPGIGGMKQDSEIGVALAAGHPCYFIGFLPTPEPGQTIEDVCAAEAAFLEEIARLHPEAEGKPVIVANCQAGWQIMMMAAIRPELCGPILLAGSPLSYWAGVRGRNPMRYLGGTLGGTWLTAMAGDLGNGIFDGANLVANFESLNPANTYWEKAYGLYSKVDTEASRFLDFETWWGSPVLLNACEMQWIADNLFVGNKLTSGEIHTSGGVRVDLRNIRSPIIVLCSWGDNITPPQQALGWITDLYEHDDEIVTNGQTIVYTLHQTIGHLGIFVSGKVATKEHAEFASCMEMIDLLPPGLYEAVITEVDDGYRPCRPHPRQVSVPSGSSLAGRHPRARRQQRGRQPALRRRGPRLRDQSRALSHARPAGRAGAGQQPERRPDAATASQPAALRRLLGPQSRDAAGEGAGRRGSRRPQAGVRRQSPARDGAGRVDLDHDLLGELSARARRHDRGDVPRHLWLAGSAGDGRAGNARGADAAPHRARPRARGDRGARAGRPREALRGGRPRRGGDPRHHACPAAGAHRRRARLRRPAGHPPPAAGQSPPQPRRDQGDVPRTVHAAAPRRGAGGARHPAPAARRRGAPGRGLEGRDRRPRRQRRAARRRTPPSGAAARSCSPPRAAHRRRRRTLPEVATGRGAAREVRAADQGRRQAPADGHGGRPSLRRGFARRRGGSSADGPAPADPGRAAGAHTRGGRQGLARYRRLRAGRRPAQPRLGRQGRRAGARRTGRSPDEGQPAYRRADGRRRGARYRHPHRPPHQPLLRHGRAGPFPGPDHLRRRREHRADARGEGRHRAERDRPCAGAHPPSRCAWRS